jgi:hypothetical protein
MRRSTTLAVVVGLGLAVGAQGCVAATDSEPSDEAGTQQSSGGKADDLFENGPLYLTGAFDGSKRFGMWVDTVDFTRYIKETYGKSLKWTYFINTCYFDPSVTGSWIGKALSQDEATVRWALVQQAINEGHEIGNHAVRHRDGTEWSYSQWRTELEEFDELVERNLFKPIHDPGVGPVFPKWRPMPSAGPGEVGAACDSDGDCDSGICLPVSDRASFCSAGCNKYNPCANGTVCGAPDWNESLDRCVPMPEFPVYHNGEMLFDANGQANLAHPDLKPYRMTGFRAPQLGHNANMC